MPSSTHHPRHKVGTAHQRICGSLGSYFVSWTTPLAWHALCEVRLPGWPPHNGTQYACYDPQLVPRCHACTWPHRTFLCSRRATGLPIHHSVMELKQQKQLLHCQISSAHVSSNIEGKKSRCAHPKCGKLNVCYSKCNMQMWIIYNLKSSNQNATPFLF